MFHGEPKGNRPLHKAALEDDVEGLARLLERRADIDQRAENGQTALHLAVEKGHARAAHVLLGYRADVNARDHQGMTPLHIAAGRGAAGLLTDLLTETGGDVTQADGMGNTPLHHAAAHGHAEVMELLLSRGANLNAKNHNGHTPLHEAVGRQSPEAVAFLLKRKAAVNDGDTFSRTPLHLAAKAGAKPIVEQLLASGADANAADHFGSTPLHEAALRGQLRVAAVLLQHGADSERKDQLGRTPAQAAAANQQGDMVTLLQKHRELKAELERPAAPPPPAPEAPKPEPHDAERERLSEQLAQQSRMFEEILNAIPDYLFLLDRSFRFTYVNRRAAQALGHDQAYFVGKTWQELGLPAECMLPLSELCAGVFVTRQPKPGTLTLPSREGAREMDCLVSPIHRADGEIATVLCATRDASEQPAGLGQKVAELEQANARLLEELAAERHMQETLQAVEERFRRLAEAASEGIIFSEHGIITDANPQASLITGYQHFELIGMRVLDLIHPAYSEIAGQHINSQFHHPYRCCSVHKDGDPVWVEVQGKTLASRDRQTSVAIIRPVEEPPRPTPPGTARMPHLYGAVAPPVPPDDVGRG
ncbi:MAG: ankyrin repeat domain-containing protein [Armatimonadota bacterium]